MGEYVIMYMILKKLKIILPGLILLLINPGCIKYVIINPNNETGKNCMGNYIKKGRRRYDYRYCKGKKATRI